MKKALILSVVIAVLLGFMSIASAYVRIQSTTGVTLSWDKTSIPVNWYVDQDGAPGIKIETVQKTIENSFNAWQNVPCSYITFEYKGSVNVTVNEVGVEKFDGKNVMIWINENEWPGEWTDAFAVTVPLFDSRTGKIVDADILFNKNFPWSVAPEGEEGKADLQNIATHEIGHLLGLDHPSILDATMYFSSLAGETYKRTLASDDIQGICSIYPVAGKPAAPCQVANECESNMCVAHEASGGSICSQACECDPDCTNSLVCIDKQCVPPKQEVGGIGSSCSSKMPCGSNLICVSGLCSKYCNTVADCPENWDCMALQQGGKACYTDNPVDPNEPNKPSDIQLSAFNMMPPSPAAPGTVIDITASATSSEKVYYRFSVRPVAGEWTKLNDYSTINTTTWTPQAVGNFEILVELKTESSNECADFSKTYFYSTETNPGVDGDSTAPGPVDPAPTTDGDSGIRMDADGGGCASSENHSVFLLLLLFGMFIFRQKRNLV